MSQLKSRPRKTRMKQEDHTNPTQSLNERLGHIYDPGDFTGGITDPLPVGYSPKKSGCLLIFGGVILLLFMIITPIKAEHSWPILIAGIPFSVLALLAGFKLIRKPSPKYDSEKLVEEIRGPGES